MSTRSCSQRGRPCKETLKKTSIFWQKSPESTRRVFPLKHMIFADAAYAGRRKQRCKESVLTV